jgi:hypothetical protein
MLHYVNDNIIHSILKINEIYIQGVFEIRAQILITSYWLHVELGKNI